MLAVPTVHNAGGIPDQLQTATPPVAVPAAQPQVTSAGDAADDKWQCGWCKWGPADLPNVTVLFVTGLVAISIADHGDHSHLF